MDKIINIQNTNPYTFQLQNYSSEDDALISNFIEKDIVFDPSQDYVEYFIFDLNQNILFSNVYGYPGYKLHDNLISIDPQNDLESHGFTDGQYYTLYNFLRRKLSSNAFDVLFIQDISPNRTELRLNSTKISNNDIINLTTQFSSEIAASSGSYLDFYVNFGNNQLVIANNIALDSTDPNNPTILIKLYEPLPPQFIYNSQCWIVEKIAEPQAYQIEFTTIFTPESQFNYINGPNFNINIQDQINNSTPYYNQNSLQNSISLLGSGSLLYQINSILSEKGIEINIDYSDYSQFVNFSSAQTRLENFYYKLSLIEQYAYNAGLPSGITSQGYFTSASQVIWQNKINDIITNFDGYEYYLYYSSGSTAWPKTNSVYPYVNELTTGTNGINWFASQSSVASIYDSNNNNNLINTIPGYLREDDTNSQYFLFIQMIGQHFDNVWTYTKDITNKFNADNRLNYGISKDIVAQAIRDLGVKIYQNNFSSNDLYSALLGITPSGSLFNIPNVSTSYPVSTGLEYIKTFITASSTSSLEPVDDINKETYKRIYHNLPILLKKKGTTEGLKMLINLYGIPDTILNPMEFGGKSEQNQSWDTFKPQFNYAFTIDSLSVTPGYLRTSWEPILKHSISPNTLEFRFKTHGMPTTNPYYQVLAYAENMFALVLGYSGSIGGTYSGAISSSYNLYGSLQFIDLSNAPTYNSCSISLPFFNQDWWSVMVTSDTASTYLYSANNIYDGYDGSNVGFTANTSSNSVSQIWNGSTTFYLSHPLTPATSFVSIGGKNCYPFSGSFQELRFYGNDNKIAFSQSIFNDFVMNPYSIEGLTLTGSLSSFNTLGFRAPLGTMLESSSITGSRTSIHPAISIYPPSSSFVGNSAYTLSGSFSFTPNTETIYQNQFVAGIQNPVSEKIRIVNTVVPSGNTLSQYISIQQTSPQYENFTKDINYIEVAFSPQNEVNNDIIAQLGYFNLGTYIGDPRYLISGSLNYYPDFNKLRDYYFSKYTHNYNLNDYVRLIKFFDNSLFKMIQDFTPAKSDLSSGIVIKPSLLERCRYPQPKINTQTTIAFVGSPTSNTLNIQY